MENLRKVLQSDKILVVKIKENLGKGFLKPCNNPGEKSFLTFFVQELFINRIRVRKVS